MKMRTLIVGLIMLTAYQAYAQAVSGTIVIMNFTKDELVVAADSRATHVSTGAPDDTFCKISAFGHKFVFTSVGTSAWERTDGSPFPSWKNSDLALDAVRLVPKIEPVSNLALITERWATDVKDRLARNNAVDPNGIRAMAKSNHAQITAGMFFDTDLNAKIGVISYDAERPIDPLTVQTADGRSLSYCWPCGQLDAAKICGIGVHLDVAAKFCSLRKHGDKIKVRTILHGASKSAQLATEIVELTKDEYESVAHDVGGDVDTLTITKNGITWNSRKHACPENQD